MLSSNLARKVCANTPRPMFLKPPRGSDKPKSTRTNNGAFTNRPLPKRKAFKPPEEQESKIQKQDTPLVTWTRANKSDCSPIFKDILQYVLDGPPFRGDVKFGSKEEVKSLGAQWHRNPQSEEDEQSEDKKDKKGDKVKRGWWAAWDDKTLFSLLNINKTPDTILWRAHGAEGGLVDGECSVLKKWVDEFYMDVHGSEERSKVVSHSEKILSMVNEDREYNAVGNTGQESSRTSGPITLKVPNIEYRQWQGDTSCSACSVTVSDQFLDCKCDAAEWKRCPVCWLQWRCDAAATANTSCGCEITKQQDPLPPTPEHDL